MRAALDEARAALATGDVPIGAVVLDPDGAVIGRGRNVRERDGDPTGHAEVVALRAAAAARRASGGSTAAPWWSPSSRARCAPARSCCPASTALVFGAYDDKAGAVGSLWDVVRDRRLNHRPEVVGGVLAERVPEPCWTISSPTSASGSLSRGGVSERPKEHASKACVGASPPWVQIPPPPPAM